jgi:hypothetical protein
MVSVLDEAVLVDAAEALSGRWDPATESDDERRRRLVACAQLVLYAEQRGLHLTALRASHAAAGDDVWLRAAVDPLEDVSDGPGDADVDALASIYEDDTLSATAAQQLARCMLDDAVQCLVIHAKHTLRHSRDGDLPSRLLLLEPAAAVDQLDLAPGEEPRALPPALASVAEPWWLPT